MAEYVAEITPAEQEDEEGVFITSDEEASSASELSDELALATARTVRVPRALACGDEADAPPGVLLTYFDATLPDRPSGSAARPRGPCGMLIFEATPQDASWAVPGTRWVADSPAPSGVANEAETRFGGWLSDIASFDGAMFSISPAEAALMDPQHRLLLLQTAPAVATVPKAVASRFGVFVGISTMVRMTSLPF